MGANRSRTENWKHCLQQIAERGGALEIAIKADHLLNPERPGAEKPEEEARPKPTGRRADAPTGDLIWRVRVLSVDEREVVVEHPAFSGKQFRLSMYTELVAGMTIGQNRWMFGTRVIGARQVRASNGRPVQGLILALPERVERCSRRSFYRVSTAEFSLPSVECWPLLDVTTAAPAEAANRLELQQKFAQQHSEPAQQRTILAPGQAQVVEPPSLLPEVGPQFSGRLVNISSGGVGLMFNSDCQSQVDRYSHLWCRVNLRPQLPAPVAITLKRIHTHLDATQKLYGGFSFDFTFHPEHQAFISELLGRYVELVEQHQRAAKARSAA